MRVRINDISWNGLSVKGSLGLKPLNERMAEGQQSGIEFTRAPEVDMLILRTHGGAEVKGTLRSSYAQSCGYCLEPVNRDLELPLHFFLKERPSADEGGRDEEYIDDIGVYFYSGEHFDFEPPLQELLILALSPFWTPACDEAGNCSICHKLPPTRSYENQQSINTLGQLLTQAGVKK
ncbi:MAG: DUF177 domain-containing protein [Bdellovibrionota bacterium]|nr:MAG: DUF177 domain-containing protein [Bdellovibrionota bacterium]